MVNLTEEQLNIVGDGTDLPADAETYSEEKDKKDAEVYQDLGLDAFGHTVQDESEEVVVKQEEEISIDTPEEPIEQPGRQFNIVSPSDMTEFDSYMLDQEYSADYIDPELVTWSQEQTGKSVFGASMRQMNSLYRLSREAAMNVLTDNNNIDASFDVESEYLKVREEFPAFKQQNYLWGANNSQNFLNRLQHLRQDNTDLLTLSQAGTLEMFTKGAITSIVDIDILLPQLAVSKLAKTSGKIAALQGRLGNIANGAASAVAANAVTGAVLKEVNPNYTDGDYVVDIALGFGLGSIFGSLHKGYMTPEVLSQVDGVKFDSKGNLELENIDTKMQEFKVHVDNVTKAGSHSPENIMPYGALDTITKGWEIDAKLSARLYQPNISKREMNNIARDIRVKHGPGYKLSPEEKNKIRIDSREITPEQVRFNTEVQSKAYSKAYNKAVTKEPSPAMADFLHTDIHEARAKAVEGEDVIDPKTDVTPEEADTVKTQLTSPEEMTLDSSEINAINKTLNSDYRKGLVKLEGYKVDKKGVPTLIMRNNNGSSSVYNGADASYMTRTLRSLVLQDYSAALSKVDSAEVKKANERMAKIIKKYIPEVYTDFVKASKMKDSIIFTRFVNDMLVSALDNNTVGGVSVHTVKEGVTTRLSHGLSLFKSSVDAHATELARKQKKSLILNNSGWHADTDTARQASKAVSDLKNDIRLAKTDKAKNLAKDLEPLYDKYRDYGGEYLLKNKELQRTAEALGEKYQESPHTIKAILGTGIVSRNAVDAMQTIPKESSMSKGFVEGAEELDYSDYQTQVMSGEYINWLRDNDFRESDVIGASEDINKLSGVAKLYYEGMLLDNPKMDVEMAKEIANLNARGSVGRAWAGVSDKNAAKAAKTKFQDDLTRFINNKDGIPENVKAELLTMQHSLEADALESSFLKARTPFDRTGTFKIQSSTGQVLTVSGGDIMKTPNPDLWGQYINRTAGEVALAAKGWGRADLINSYSLMREEFKKAGVPQKDQQFYQDMFDATLAVVQSQPNPQSMKRGNAEQLALVKRLFNLNALGGLVFSQGAEFVTTFSGIGVINGLQHIGIRAVNKMSRKELLESSSLLDMVSTPNKLTEYLESTAMVDLEELGKVNIGQKFQKHLTTAEEAHRKVTLMEPVKMMQRRLSWHTTMTNIAKQLDKSGYKQTPKLKNMGVDAHFINIMKREIDSGRMYMRHGVLRDNYDNTDLPAIFNNADRDKITGVISSIIKNEKILRPQAGSSDFRLADPFVSLMLHLKTYPLFSVNSVFLRQLKYADRYTASMFMTAGLMSYASTYMKAIAYGYDTDDITNFDAFMRYNSLLGGVGMTTDAVADLLNIPELQIGKDFGGKSNGFNIPIEGYIDSLLGLGSLPRDILEDGELSHDSYNNIKKTLPIMNLWTAKALRELGDAIKAQEANSRQEAAAEESDAETNPFTTNNNETIPDETSREERAVNVLDAFTTGN